MSEGIYLDNNATTMVAPEVVETMLPYFSEQFGNPSSLHQFGKKVGRAIKKARQQVQELLGAEHDSEISQIAECVADVGTGQIAQVVLACCWQRLR